MPQIVGQPITGVLATDFAHYTPEAVPQELIDGGVKLAIIKVDKNFIKSATRCAEKGLEIAGYHWCDITESNNAQRDRTLQRCEGLPVRGIMCDVEQYWSSWEEWYAVYVYKTMAWNLMKQASAQIISNQARDMFSLFSKEIYTFGYSSMNFIKEHCEPYSDSWINNYDWFMAHYRNQPTAGTRLTWQEVKDNWMPNYEPFYPTALQRKKLVGHQFTGDHIAVKGLYQEYFGKDDPRNKYALADINVVDEDWYNRLVEKEIPSPENPPIVIPPPEEGEIMNLAGIVKQNVNLRAGHATSYAMVLSASIQAGASITASEYGTYGGEEWLHITSINGAPVDGWSVSTWNGTKVIEYWEVVTTPPTDPPAPSGKAELISFDATLEDPVTKEQWTQSWQKGI